MQQKQGRKGQKGIGHVNGALLPKTEREVESLVSLPQPSASVGISSSAKASAPEPGTTRDNDQVNAAPPSAPNVRTESASLCNSDAFPMIRAGVPRSAAFPTSTSLMSDAASARRQRTAR
jgi:hypothetical protein